jgi:hypothetical protein
VHCHTRTYTPIAMALRHGLLRGTGLLLRVNCQQGLIHCSPALHSLSLLADSCRRDAARPSLRQTLFIEDPQRWVQLLRRQHLSTDGKQASSAGSSGSPSMPDAQQCDSAIEKYEKLRTKYDEAIWEPPLPKTPGQRLKGAWAVLIKALIMTRDFALKVPGWARTLSAMSREDWSSWWAGAKKTIKHEAHHYWVGGRGASRAPGCRGRRRARASIRRRPAGGCARRAGRLPRMRRGLRRRWRSPEQRRGAALSRAAPPAWHRPAAVPRRPQVGTKLLAYDARIASRLAVKAASGKALTRWGGEAPAGPGWARRHAAAAAAPPLGSWTSPLLTVRPPPPAQA